jgi:hypothetical protein
MIDRRATSRLNKRITRTARITRMAFTPPFCPAILLTDNREMKTITMSKMFQESDRNGNGSASRCAMATKLAIMMTTMDEVCLLRPSIISLNQLSFVNCFVEQFAVLSRVFTKLELADGDYVSPEDVRSSLPIRKLLRSFVTTPSHLW